MSVAKKIGCYFCTGCGIGDALDMKALKAIATKEQKIPVVKEHAFLCGAEGVAMIRNDLETDAVNAVIIAACSHREKTAEFRFGIELFDRVDLRDKCLWVLDVKEGDETAEEDRQMAAEDYLRLGCVKIKKMNIPDPFLHSDGSKDVLVVGGGLAGLTAARDIALAGYQAVVVEKAETLGGKMNNMLKVTPDNRPPYRDLTDNFIGDLIAQVEGDNRIKVFKNTVVTKTAGQPGRFDVTLKSGGTPLDIRVGSIVVATGFDLYDPAKLPGNLGYGSSPDVVTSAEFEKMAKAGQILRKSDGKPAKRVAFALCAGQRDKAHLDYCSGACCIYSMKQALYVIEQYKQEASTFLIYQEIRTPGQMEDFYRKAQDEGAVFIKGDVAKVTANSGGGVAVEVKDHLLRGSESLDVDLLVLATGMVSTVDTIDPNVASQIGAGRDELPGSVLNLQYRQGPSLPRLGEAGFPDSHFICFPYETRRTGIYVAGPARRPMGIAATMTDATGAALKAIQAVEAVAGGVAVHPRSGDLSFPSYRPEGCTQCKRCTEECPFGAINEDDKGNPLFNPARCRRCSTCMGACPQKIISFANYSVDMISTMLKEIEIPEEDEEKPRILVFACTNDAIPAMDMMGRNRGKISPYIRIIPLRCMGSLSLVWIADAMSKGFDGVLLMGCRHGDDYQCHNVRGSSLAETRLSKVSETLDRLKLESVRVKMMEVNIMDADSLPKAIDGFVEQIAKLKPNPYKGF
ncbi:MAG: hydrogenase iron-sulfur subunit [Magnetococcales bacterium]|nr:hydrogenase iron-sulfur subunit [Magnetococcales bacterium]